MPINLTALAGDGEVNLSWTASEGATSYNIKRSTVAGGPYTTIGTSSTTDYIDSTVVNGTTYYYVVTAVNSAGESENSNEVSATPVKPVYIADAPINLTAIAGDGEVSLSWTASEGATSYNIKRSTVAGGPYTTIGTSSTFNDRLYR